MGGGSGSAERSGTATSKTEEPKTYSYAKAEAAKYKSVKQAPDFIREQTGLDIEKFRNAASKQFEKRGQITIDISNMSQKERTKLTNALRQKYSPFTGEQSGTWLFTITKKRS